MMEEPKPADDYTRATASAIVTPPPRPAPARGQVDSKCNMSAATKAGQHRHERIGRELRKPRTPQNRPCRPERGKKRTISGPSANKHPRRATRDRVNKKNGVDRPG